MFISTQKYSDGWDAKIVTDDGTIRVLHYLTEPTQEQIENDLARMLEQESQQEEWPPEPQLNQD